MIKYIFIVIVVILVSCKEDQASIYQELNLTQYGLPITIHAPENAEVKTMSFGLTKDVSIHKDDHYYIQIFSSDIRTNDLDKVKNELLSDVKSEPFFDQIIETLDDGFIYKTVMDSTLTTFGFKSVKLIGNNEIVFGQGLIGTFSLEDIKKMYNAVME